VPNACDVAEFGVTRTDVEQTILPIPQNRTIKDDAMKAQLRVWKVLLVLLVSMTSGAIVLMTLRNNPPLAGAFCLSSYYRLAPTDTAISSRIQQSFDNWQSIEIYYSGTRVGNIEWLASLNGFRNTEDLNCHFVICNGYGGEDGQIQTTEKWQDQVSVKSGKNWDDSRKTIRICIVSDGKTAFPTDCQVKRVETLTETLCRHFRINPLQVHTLGSLMEN